MDDFGSDFADDLFHDARSGSCSGVDAKTAPKATPAFVPVIETECWYLMKESFADSAFGEDSLRFKDDVERLRLQATYFYHAKAYSKALECFLAALANSLPSALRTNRDVPGAGNLSTDSSPHLTSILTMDFKHLSAVQLELLESVARTYLKLDDYANAEFFCRKFASAAKAKGLESIDQQIAVLNLLIDLCALKTAPCVWSCYYLMVAIADYGIDCPVLWLRIGDTLLVGLRESRNDPDVNLPRSIPLCEQCAKQAAVLCYVKALRLLSSRKYRFAVGFVADKNSALAACLEGKLAQLGFSSERFASVVNGDALNRTASLSTSSGDSQDHALTSADSTNKKVSLAVVGDEIDECRSDLKLIVTDLIRKLLTVHLSSAFKTVVSGLSDSSTQSKDCDRTRTYADCISCSEGLLEQF